MAYWLMKSEPDVLFRSELPIKKPATKVTGFYLRKAKIENQCSAYPKGYARLKTISGLQAWQRFWRYHQKHPAQPFA